VSETAPKPLLSGPPTVINIGLERFATDLAQAGVAVSNVQWQPPARGNARLARLLSKLGS
jgi:hypothetical protein